MNEFENMSLSEVVEEVITRIESRMDQTTDLEYPDRSTDSILKVLEKARDYASSDSIVGFAVASSFLDCIIQGHKVVLPEDLSDRLHARLS
jgi:hypothetical protein